MVFHGSLNIRFNKSLWKDKIPKRFIASDSAGDGWKQGNCFSTSNNPYLDLIKWGSEFPLLVSFSLPLLLPWLLLFFSSGISKKPLSAVLSSPLALIPSDRKTNETWVLQKITFISHRNMLNHTEGGWVMHLMEKRPVQRRGHVVHEGCGESVLLGHELPPILNPPFSSLHPLFVPHPMTPQTSRGWVWHGLHNHCELFCVLIQQILNCMHTMCQRPC